MNALLWQRARWALGSSFALVLLNVIFAVVSMVIVDDVLLRFIALFWVVALIVNGILVACAAREYDSLVVVLGFATCVIIGTLSLCWLGAIPLVGLIMLLNGILNFPELAVGLWMLAALLGSAASVVMGVQCYRAADMLLYRTHERPRTYRPIDERLPKRWLAEAETGDER